MSLTKRKSGIPTGNAGEYFVMGELLRRGLDAQLADRNTKGYDLLVGRSGQRTLRKVQVKTARSRSWWVNRADFKDQRLQLVTIYVLMGHDTKKPVRYFIAKNHDLKRHFNKPHQWKQHGFISMKALEQYEGRWNTLFK